jgi:hypothetical protein
MTEFAQNWAALQGIFEFGSNEIVFKGEPAKYRDQQGQEQVGFTPGLALSSTRFAGGEITAAVEFTKVTPLNSCELVFYYDAERKTFLSAGVGWPPAMYAIRRWDGLNGISEGYALAGDRRNLRAGQVYHLSASIQGSRVRLSTDGVEVLSAVLPFPLPPSQVGIYCFDDSDLFIRDFKASKRPGQVFVVMQFTSPFNELFEHVVKPVCAEEPFNLEARRADDAFGPGLVMADVINDIVEAEFVIAEITPANPNVYFELGYAAAIGKPVIMLANRKDLPKLPFDIAGSRVLFYDDSMIGRSQFEDHLRKHIGAILQKQTLPVAQPVIAPSGRGGLTQR